MLAPVHTFYSLRDHPDLGVVATVMATSLLFAATPFVIPAVAEDFGVSIGRSGMLSAAQVGGFAATVFFAGRTLRTHRRYLVVGALAAVVFNLLSAVVPTFESLLVLRVFTGSAAGLLVWLAWSNAMRTSRALRNVSAAGPLSVLVSVPILAWIAHEFGSSGVYLALAIVSLPPAFLPAEFAGYRRVREHVSPSKSNIVLVMALGLMTLSGSATFVFGAAIGAATGLSALVVSLGYSANALAGFIAARRPPAERLTSIWVFGNAACAALVVFGDAPILFMIGITMWGFCFWMVTPTILRSVAGWSVAPDERVGDAQSSMAVGRAIGPALGSALVVGGSYDPAGAFTVAGLVVAGVIVLSVRIYRQSHLPPVGAVAEPATRSRPPHQPGGTNAPTRPSSRGR
jgi:DHA1 family inner membrane transport protein